MGLRPTEGQNELPVHEELLIDYAERLARHTQGRRAVHIHLSQLGSQHRRTNYFRIAANTFVNLANDYEGQLFQLSNNDLIVIVKNATVMQMDECVLRLRDLFADDPLLDDETAAHQLCTWYDLERQFDEFKQLASDVYEAHQKTKSARGLVGRGDSEAQAQEAPLQPVNVAQLSRILEVLSTSDITPLLRRQTICAVLPAQPPTPVFNEVFVSIDDLRKRVAPEFNLTANRWLFQHLTEVLDERLLRALPDTERAVDLPTSININVSSLLSEAFQHFDRQFRVMTDKAMIFELQAIDIFGDMGAYLFACDMAHDRGYKICLDGLNHLTFPMIPRAELKLDFMKLFWSRELRESASGARGEAMREAIKRAGAHRIIMCRCDNIDALDFGRELGIHMYQGRYVEGLLTAAARR